MGRLRLPSALFKLSTESIAMGMDYETYRLFGLEKEANTMSELTDLERMQIEHACASLSIAYANHVDARR
jgi:hypothetical protein